MYINLTKNAGNGFNFLPSTSHLPTAQIRKRRNLTKKKLRNKSHV